MKTIKILLGIIAINLTLLTIIQTGVWPPKVQASETNTISTMQKIDGNYYIGCGDGIYYCYEQLDPRQLKNWSKVLDF